MMIPVLCIWYDFWSYAFWLTWLCGHGVCVALSGAHLEVPHVALDVQRFLFGLCLWFDPWSLGAGFAWLGLQAVIAEISGVQTIDDHWLVQMGQNSRKVGQTDQN